MVILSGADYNMITDYIQQYNGLAIDLEDLLKVKFKHIPPITSMSILCKCGQMKLRQLNYKCQRVIQDYERLSKNSRDDKIILDLSVSLNYPPLGLCRLILNDRYSKAETKEMLKDPNLIPDLTLCANVFTCIYNDMLDGPMIDIVRFSIGEEYEIKLKTMAKQHGLSFFDEGDLRRDGFDKTPDLLLAVQCLYNGIAINWIESKASFGDIDSHSKYIRDQLSSYQNRFGTGIVLYWFGYHEDIVNMKNGDLIILDTFPAKEQLTLLQFDTS